VPRQLAALPLDQRLKLGADTPTSTHHEVGGDTRVECLNNAPNTVRVWPTLRPACSVTRVQLMADIAKPPSRSRFANRFTKPS
jgi:hypothetical protein